MTISITQTDYKLHVMILMPNRHPTVLVSTVNLLVEETNNYRSRSFNFMHIECNHQMVTFNISFVNNKFHLNVLLKF